MGIHNKYRGSCRPTYTAGQDADVVLMIVLSVHNGNREACHSLTYIVPHLLDSGDRLTRGFGMDMGNYLNKSGSDRGVQRNLIDLWASQAGSDTLPHNKKSPPTVGKAQN